MQLDQDVQGLQDRPSNLFVPRLIALFQNSHPDIRHLAVGCVNQLLTAMPRALYENLDQYLQVHLLCPFYVSRIMMLYGNYGTRVFGHSDDVPCRSVYMSRT